MKKLFLMFFSVFFLNTSHANSFTNAEIDPADAAKFLETTVRGVFIEPGLETDEQGYILPTTQSGRIARIERITQTVERNNKLSKARGIAGAAMNSLNAPELDAVTSASVDGLFNAAAAVNTLESKSSAAKPSAGSQANNAYTEPSQPTPSKTVAPANQLKQAYLPIKESPSDSSGSEFNFKPAVNLNIDSGAAPGRVDVSKLTYKPIQANSVDEASSTAYPTYQIPSIEKVPSGIGASADAPPKANIPTSFGSPDFQQAPVQLAALGGGDIQGTTPSAASVNPDQIANASLGTEQGKKGQSYIEEPPNEPGNASAAKSTTNSAGAKKGSKHIPEATEAPEDPTEDTLVTASLLDDFGVTDSNHNAFEELKEIHCLNKNFDSIKNKNALVNSVLNNPEKSPFIENEGVYDCPKLEKYTVLETIQRRIKHYEDLKNNPKTNTEETDIKIAKLKLTRFHILGQKYGRTPDELPPKEEHKTLSEDLAHDQPIVLPPSF